MRAQTPNPEPQIPGKTRRLIRKVVKGKILSIRDLGEGEYEVWTKYVVDGDTDAEVWDIYYYIRVSGNEVEVLTEDWE